jgi:hypothetical protein
MRAERMHGGMSVLGATLLAIGAGAVVAELQTVRLGSVQPWTLWWALLAVSVLVLVRGGVQVLTSDPGQGVRGLGSVILAAGTLVAVLLPGAQLLLGTSTLRLAQYGLDPSDLDAALSAAFTVFLFALLAFWFGEGIAGRFPSRGPDAPRPVRDERLTYLVLVVVSLAAHFATPSAGLEDRAALGHGITNVLGWGVPLAIALGIARHHWGSRTLALVSLALLLGVVLELGTRSPLFLVGIAIAHRLIAGAARGRRPLARVALLALLVYLAAVVAIGVSAWRYEVSHGESASLVTALGDAAANPFHDLSSRAQLDSLEGLVLSMQVDRSRVGASWLDPTKAFVNFVPRQLWPSKPQWLGPQVTQRYLDIGGNAGVFLSGPGYAWIVYGGVFGVIGAFLILGFGTQRLYLRRTLAEGGALLLSYFCLRFFFGGDAFDLFQVLGLAALLWTGRVVAGGLGRLFVVRPSLAPAGGPNR